MRFGIQIPDALDPRASATIARGLAHWVVTTNAALMRAAEQRGARVPMLYDSNIQWRMQANAAGCGQHWALWPEIAKRGWGDCKDLCAWRVAELRHTGADPGATVLVYWRRLPGEKKARMYHAEVRRTNACADSGYREDPSRFLGMPS
jgi:hypothetical protein